MKRAKVVLSTGFLLLGLAGCASTSGSGGAARDPNLISRSLLREAEPEGISAFQLIDRLRSRWLQTRGATSVTNSASYAMVVLDDVRHGELNTLLNMDLVGIEEMRFLNARDATTRFGTGFDGGAILVFSRGRGLRTTASRTRDSRRAPFLRAGERVRMTAEGSWTGVVQRSGSDSITLLVDEVFEQVSFHWASVEQLEVFAGRNSRGKGGLIGAAIGGVAGLVGGFILAPGNGLLDCRLLNSKCESIGITEAAAYSATGMLIGGVTGALVDGGERWTPVELPVVRLGFVVGGGGSIAMKFIITPGR